MRKGILRIRGNILYPRGNMEYNTIEKNQTSKRADISKNSLAVTGKIIT